jgi:hypothetical protein
MLLSNRSTRPFPSRSSTQATGAAARADGSTTVSSIAGTLPAGKGHGRGRDFKGLQPRHARLAIGAASTFVDFVLDRHLSQVAAETAES